MSLIEVVTEDSQEIIQQLQEKVDQAPDFFLQSPVVFSFEKSTVSDNFPLAEVISAARKMGMLPTGVKGACSALQNQATELGLAIFPKGKEKPKAPENAQQEKKAMAQESPATRVISTPVRSGQQIYAPGDLIVTAQVSAGAELLAGGNVLIYGPLRGRALAGVNGNDQAHIMCFSQEAELVAIGGHYLNDENLKTANWREPVKISFDGDQLVVEKLAI